MRVTEKQRKQKTFDRVARHVISMKTPSVIDYVDAYDEDSSKCAYRGVDNNQCAIGCLIPNYLYENQMEGKTPTTIITEDTKLGKYLIKLNHTIDRSFLGDLQSVHDYYFEDKEYELKRIAERYNLKYKNYENKQEKNTRT